MFVIYNNDNEQMAIGDTLEKAIDSWKEYYDDAPNFEDSDVVVVEGNKVEVKVGYSIVRNEPSVKPTVAKKSTTKSVAK